MNIPRSALFLAMGFWLTACSKPALRGPLPVRLGPHNLSGQNTQQRVPVIEWISTSHLTSFQFRFYDDGSIISPQARKPVSPTWTKEQLDQLLAELQRIGFFGIKDQKAYEKIALESGEHYQPESTNQIYPPGNDVIDGSTSTLIVRSHSQTNKATFFMPALYLKAYPDIAELKIFVEASRLVAQAIAPPKIAPQKSGK